MADYSNAYIGASYGIEAGAQLGSAYAQSEALRAQGKFQQTMAEINRQFSNYRSDQVLRQGADQANQLHRRGVAVQGAQRSSAAAQGIRVDDGSAADYVDQTRQMSMDDQITARNNAWREAFGIRTQAQMTVSNAQFQRRASNNAANGTLLGGVLQGLSTGMKATSFGLKAIRDQRKPGVQEDDPTKSMVSAELIQPKLGRDYDNKEFDDIFGFGQLGED